MIINSVDGRAHQLRKMLLQAAAVRLPVLLEGVVRAPGLLALLTDAEGQATLISILSRLQPGLKQDVTAFGAVTDLLSKCRLTGQASSALKGLALRWGRFGVRQRSRSRSNQAKDKNKGKKGLSWGDDKVKMFRTEDAPSQRGLSAGEVQMYNWQLLTQDEMSLQQESVEPFEEIDFYAPRALGRTVPPPELPPPQALFSSNPDFSTTCNLAAPPQPRSIPVPGGEGPQVRYTIRSRTASSASPGILRRESQHQHLVGTLQQLILQRHTMDRQQLIEALRPVAARLTPAGLDRVKLRVSGPH